MQTKRLLGVVVLAAAAIVACSATPADTGSGGAGESSRGVGGDGATGGGAGSGGAPLCTPGESIACYTGPAATRDVGACHDGTATCKSDGSGFGACVGEVTPKPEDCHTPVDEDCDGQMPACEGDPIWTKVYGGPTGGGYGAAITSDALGNVYVTGDATGDVDFGDGVTSGGPNDADIFVLKLDPTGALLWDHRYPAAPSHQYGTAIAVDAAGDVYVAGVLNDTVDLGAGPMTADGGMFLAKYDAAGDILWSKSYQSYLTSPRRLLFDPAGNLILMLGIGSGIGFPGSVDFGNGKVAASGFALANLDPDGAPIWSGAWGSPQAANNSLGAADVGLDSQGNVVVTGYLHGSADFGAGTVTSSPAYDFFLARYSGSGQFLGLHQYPTVLGFTVGGAMTLDDTDDVLVGASFAQSIDLGNTTLTGSIYGNAFAASIDVNGEAVWSHAYTCSGEDDGQSSDAGALVAGVARDSQNALFMTGYFLSQIDLGLGPVVERGPDGGDAFLAKLNESDGSTIWTKQIGGSGGDIPGSVAVDPSGAVLWTGGLTPPFDLGDGVHGSAGEGWQIVVAKLTP